MTPAAAETLAVAGLAWMAGNDEVLTGFMAQSGASADDFRQGAKDPDFLGFVLDFILSDDRWVTEFVDHGGYRPEDIWAARQALPGGQDPHWT